MKILVTADHNWFIKWNQYVKSNEQGMFSQLSYWVDSYKFIFIRKKLILALDDEDNIIGGCLVAYLGLLRWHIFTVPGGPIAADALVRVKVLNDLMRWCKKKGALYICVNETLWDAQSHASPIFKALSTEEEHFFANHKFLQKHFFNPMYVAVGLRLVELDSNFNERYSNLVKKNIKRGQNKGAIVRWANTFEEVIKGYHIIEQSAKTKNYRIRKMKRLESSFREMFDSQILKMALVFNDEGLNIGAQLIFDCNARFTNISGGINRAYAVYQPGYLVQNFLIEESAKRGYAYYDISYGGTHKVNEFKDSFGATGYYGLTLRYWLNPYFDKLLRFIFRK